MGGQFCWSLLAEDQVVGAVAAVVMLSANNPPTRVEAMRKAAGRRTIPLLIGHGTRDKVFGWDAAKALYEGLHHGGYPVRFVSFEAGNHGTPLRMIDWRDSLNWLLARG
jgi:predicted esterase